MKKYTVSDIAKMAETSPASVSRVINNLPGVNDETRSRIKKVLTETGYKITPKIDNKTISQKLFSQSSRIIALIMGDIRNPFYADITYHIQNMLEEQNYYVLLLNSDYKNNKEIEFFNLAKKIDFAGIIAVTAMDSSGFVKTINKLNCPVVLINRTIEGYTGPSVVLDNFQAGYSATKHLIELGHQKIAFVAGPEDSSSSMQRVKGYKQALLNYSLPSLKEDIYSGDLTLESGKACGRQFLAKTHENATAIICGNDLMAIGVMQACEEAGVVIPNDLSVIGFDDITISRLKKINLTTMKQPVMQMAAKTVETMLAEISNKNIYNQKHILESELIIRGTTSAPRPRI